MVSPDWIHGIVHQGIQSLYIIGFELLTEIQSAMFSKLCQGRENKQPTHQQARR